MSRKRYFAQPSLMSTSRNMVQLSYMTVGGFPSQLEKISQEELDAFRASADRDMLEYFNIISKNINKSLSVSVSIVRSYHSLDNDHFAIEQRYRYVSIRRRRVG